MRPAKSTTSSPIISIAASSFDRKKGRLGRP
jgi:hypothetical protein